MKKFHFKILRQWHSEAARRVIVSRELQLAAAGGRKRQAAISAAAPFTGRPCLSP